MYDQGFRKAAISLYNYLGNMKNVALALKIGVATVWRWLRKGIQTIKRQKKPLSETILDYVRHLLEETNTITQLEIIKKVKQTLQVHVSRQCVSCAIRLLGFSRKRLRTRGSTNMDRLKQKVDLFREGIAAIDKAMLISIDEVGFDQRMIPIYGYSKKRN